MKPIKVFFGDRRLKDIYPFATKWEVFKYKTYRIVRKFIIITVSTSALAGAMYGSFQAGRQLFPSVVYAEKEVPITVINIPPILKKIAQCESSNNQFDKNGQVLINATEDAGRYQINVPTWGKQAKEMGLNLMDEKDNETFAVWLFENKGSGPWSSSAHCWNK